MAYLVEVHYDNNHSGLIVFNRTTNRHLFSLSAGNSPASHIKPQQYLDALALMHEAHKKNRGHEYVLILWYTLEKWLSDLKKHDSVLSRSACNGDHIS